MLPNLTEETAATVQGMTITCKNYIFPNLIKFSQICPRTHNCSKTFFHAIYNTQNFTNHQDNHKVSTLKISGKNHNEHEKVPKQICPV